MKGTADLKSGALMTKSKKSETSKSIFKRIEKKDEDDPARKKYHELEIEYEQNIMTSDKVYSMRVLPIFTLCLGLFLILVDILFPNETHTIFYIGFFVTLSGLIWKIVMVKLEKKRKEEFLFGK